MEINPISSGRAVVFIGLTLTMISYDIIVNNSLQPNMVVWVGGV